MKKPGRELPGLRVLRRFVMETALSKISGRIRQSSVFPWRISTGGERMRTPLENRKIVGEARVFPKKGAVAKSEKSSGKMVVQIQSLLYTERRRRTLPAG
ncbi:MAG: hypothetical protein LUE17_10515 [Planctomycetaceae bacterium]|nr:hypothetical protein [Planctomycetaceae bacterium]